MFHLYYDYGLLNKRLARDLSITAYDSITITSQNIRMTLFERVDPKWDKKLVKLCNLLLHVLKITQEVTQQERIITK